MADEGKAQALKNFLIAQKFYPTKYEQFKKDLALAGVTLDFSNQKFLDALLRFSENFESFLKEQKEPPAPPEVMGAVAPRDLIDSLERTLPNLTGLVQEEKAKNIGLITEAYISGLRTIAKFPNEQEVNKRVVRELSRLVKETNDPRVLREKMGQVLVRFAATSAKSEEFGRRAQPIVEAVLQKSEKTIAATAAPFPSQAEITEAMLKSAARPDMWIETYIKLSAVDPAPKFEVVDRLALVNEALHATPPEGVSYNVFSQVDIGGLQKPVQGALGAALSFVPHAREKIIASGFAAATKLESAQERFGRLIVESPLFTQAVERGNKVFGPSRARNFVWDLASSIAGPPVAADVFVLEILGLAPEYSMAQVQAASAHSHSPGFFHLALSEAAGWGLQKTTGAVAKRAGVKLALGGLATKALGLFGGWIGTLIGLGGSLLGSVLGRRGSGKPQSFWASPEGIVIAALLFIVIGFPLLFYLKQVSEFGTFNEQQFGGGVRRRGGGPTINCLAPENLENPLCQFESCTGDNCAWPATGTIIQGPFAQCNGTTHSVVDAIDVLGNYLDPVYSATDGRISAIVGGCADNPLVGGCNQNYGNYVEVETPDGHILRYSHLSELFLDKVQVGQSLKKGDILGKMDASGTQSDHLHLEVRGQPQGQSIIAKYLPIDENFAKELYQCINDAGCRYCPQM